MHSGIRSSEETPAVEGSGKRDGDQDRADAIAGFSAEAAEGLMVQIPSEVLKRLNEHELKFYVRLASLGLRPVIEFKFHPARKWRFDLCLEDHKIAVEVEGVIIIVWMNRRRPKPKCPVLLPPRGRPKP